MDTNMKISEVMIKTLDKFLTEKTITDVDRTKFIPLELKDNINKVTTCLMFNCNCHSYEDPTIIPCEYTGAVIHLPAFWVEVPKTLAFNYIMDLLNDLYCSTYRQWVIDGYIGNPKINACPDINSGSCPCKAGEWVPC